MFLVRDYTIIFHKFSYPPISNQVSVKEEEHRWGNESEMKKYSTEKFTFQTILDFRIWLDNWNRTGNFEYDKLFSYFTKFSLFFCCYLHWKWKSGQIKYANTLGEKKFATIWYQRGADELVPFNLSLEICRYICFYTSIDKHCPILRQIDLALASGNEKTWSLYIFTDIRYQDLFGAVWNKREAKYKKKTIAKKIDLSSWSCLSRTNTLRHTWENSLKISHWVKEMHLEFFLQLWPSTEKPTLKNILVYDFTDGLFKHTFIFISETRNMVEYL